MKFWKLASAATLLVLSTSVNASQINITGTTVYNQVLDCQEQNCINTSIINQPPAQSINYSLPALTGSMSINNSPIPPNGIGIGYVESYPALYNLESISAPVRNIFNDTFTQWNSQVSLNDFSFTSFSGGATIERFMWSPSDTTVTQLVELRKGFTGSYTDANYNYQATVYSIFSSVGGISYETSDAATLLAQTPYQFEEIVDWINSGHMATNDYLVVTQNDLVSGSSETISRFVFGTADVTAQISSVPIPSALWLFSSGLIGLIGLTRRRK